MLRILVSNDDGIDAFGIRTLVRFLSHMAEVYVVAPDKQRSASGQAITLGGKVAANQVEMDGGGKSHHSIWNSSRLCEVRHRHDERSRNTS